MRIVPFHGKFWRSLYRTVRSPPLACLRFSSAKSVVVTARQLLRCISIFSQTVCESIRGIGTRLRISNSAPLLNCDKISTSQELRRFALQLGHEFRQRTEKWGYLRAARESFTADCTKNRHGLVNELHSVDSRGDKDAQFSLTIKIESVKTTSFFDTFPSFSGWCGVRGSSEITLKHCKMSERRSVRVYSKALVEENRSPSRRQDRVPRRWTGLSGWR